MQGIYYLLSIAAVFIVFIWYIRNDHLTEGERTSGLLAMTEPPPPSKDRAKKAGSSSASAGGSVAAIKDQAQSFRQGSKPY